VDRRQFSTEIQALSMLVYPMLAYYVFELSFLEEFLAAMIFFSSYPGSPTPAC